MFYKKTYFIQLSIQILATLFFFPLCSQATDQPEILDLDLSSLMEIQITSAGRKEQSLADVPAAVYVIDQEKIRNSGATSIPELLRMVPGLQIARISSNKWAVASRGFNGTFSNKLLVQIDGRSVYSHGYSGVYWDMQNVMLEDIERVEVIRGPGATLWGANAVNGVINIITKSSSETMGGLVSTGVGNHEDGMVSLRYGTLLEKNIYGRFYVNHHAQDSYQYITDASNANDNWKVTSGGMRFDGDIGLDDTWTLQSDFYDGEEKQQIFPYWIKESPLPLKADDTIDIQGYNMLGRWQRKFTATNSFTLQAYFDFTDRQELYLGQTYNTIDFDFQHRFQCLERHDIVWGLGYRNIDDSFDNTYMVSMLPDQQTRDLFSGFMQDEINLFKDRLWLTVGTKLEHNDYTDTEIQPSAKFLWKLKENHNFWTSVSKAVRTPSRAENSANLVFQTLPVPPYPKVYVNGNLEMTSEEVTAYEAGYRYIKSPDFSVDLSLFHNVYRNLTDYSFKDMTTIQFINGMKGISDGFELSTQWRGCKWLTTELNYSYTNIQMELTNHAGVKHSVTDIVAENSTPQHQIYLQNTINLNKNTRLNITGRYVDELKIPSAVAYHDGTSVDDYLALDINICWSPLKNLEIMLSGQNLTDSNHLEFVNEYFTPAIEIEQSIYAKITWKL